MAFKKGCFNISKSHRLARNRTFREEDYSPLLNLFLKWQKTI